MSADEVAKINADHRWYSAYTISKDVYANSLKDQSRDVPTFTEAGNRRWIALLLYGTAIPLIAWNTDERDWRDVSAAYSSPSRPAR